MGQFICNSIEFKKIKYRLYDKDRNIVQIFSLNELISKTFRRGCFEYRGCFTGLKDKNGTEIYEGDILDLHSTVNGVNLFEVYYDEKNARFSIKYYSDLMNHRNKRYEYNVTEFFKPCELSGEVDYEVIGNIYENPEFLGDR